MGLLKLLGISKKIDLPLGREKNIVVAIDMYTGGIRWNTGGALLRLNKKITDYDLSVGCFIRLRGYSGTFRISSNFETWDGFYNIELIRENPSKDYKGKIPRLDTFSE